MRTLRRQEREVREVGLSWARAKVCRTTINQRSITTKCSEKERGKVLAAGQTHNAFNVEGLGEKIDHMDFFHMITSLQEQARIARQRCRIAGYIDDSLHAESRQQLSCLGAQARAWRVHNNQLRLHVQAARQKAFHRAQDRDNILDGIGLKIGSGSGSRFHGKNLVETL